MNKLLCIVGSTGTGKTAKAVEIAELLPSIIVSADSRQVYRHMDIVTGKDHPENIKIYGIDIVDPNESCSVAVWYDHVMPHIQAAWETGKLVIVVGGTGLYVKALTDGIPTMQVPINQPLRDSLTHLSVMSLQEKIKEKDPKKYEQLNQSDKHNPRRLIRAIEVAQHPQTVDITPLTHSSILIGLEPPEQVLYESVITQRVQGRIEQGAIEETKRMMQQYGLEHQSMSAIGYKSILSYLQQEVSEEEMIKRWVADELAYAKRQLTWFTKVDAIKWYDRNITGGEIYANTKD